MWKRYYGEKKRENLSLYFPVKRNKMKSAIMRADTTGNALQDISSQSEK